jgi:radical SAM superfamily enzyme YgiQ (UPF0313 family)
MTMLDLAGGMPFKEILGIAFKKGPEVVVNPDRPLCADLDALPFPARHLLDMTFYTRPSRFISRNLSLRSTSIFTARGCPYRCNFCAGPLLFNQKVRFHSPERVIEEIGQLINQYGAEGIYFAEDMFLSDKGRAKKFMGLFKQYGYDKKIRWFAQLRANIVDAELLYMMKDCGCAQVEYGFESGSQRILDLMNKKASIEQNIRAARLTRNAGIRFQGNIIVGYPGEQEEDFKKTIKFLWKSRPHSIGFNLFMPLPGTPSYQRLKLDNRPLPAWDTIGDAEVVDFNYADMPPGRFAKLYMKARLTTVLPINLFYFLKYNSRDPIRLCRMITTQFRGVIIKLVRGIFKLAK